MLRRTLKLQKKCTATHEKGSKMPKEKTVTLKAGKTRQVILSYEDQTTIWNALSNAKTATTIAFVPRDFRLSILRLEKQFKEMISK
jgi:hypothetical protein